ncbi:helix-turn-helix transcriptional regulator [Rummeliibacillus sp. TYF-LIM-RU47]|uniref:helix-turn-helix transcriptional regulator n=1 Tax=Rummeliibacillus sp. TYF-LIM-RU47 TaxID=2608406 RepID=UPI00123AEC4C|nr:helix-turn-helix transcriptional regulator [Rummeliibacillus sp. TYF-LIM-RU47]
MVAKIESKTKANVNLINARLAKKLTQSKLAKKVGMSQGAIAHLERGINKAPEYPNALKIANALEKSVEFLFFNSK